MTKETKERIAREALREYPANRYMSDDLFFTRQAQQESYIAGAEKEAERAQGLVEQLEWIEGWVSDRHGSDNPISERIRKTLTNYNSK